MREGLAALRAFGEYHRRYYLALLAEGYGQVGQVAEGLDALAEALALANKNRERWYEAELHRLRGELRLTQSSVQSLGSSVQTNQKAEIETNSQPLAPNPQAEAEACFWKAIEIAGKQQAKSLELRAVMSLSQLWQQQGKQTEAHRDLRLVQRRL